MRSRIRLLWMMILLIGAGLPIVAQSISIDSIISPAACRQIVETLAADSFLGRLTGTEKGEQAGQYIADQLAKAGCAPGAGKDTYFMPFSAMDINGRSVANNVMGILTGKSKPGEFVIFSAHYDHVGTLRTNPVNFLPEKGKPEKGDTIYNGANDNASGISALILLARYYAQAANNERTLVFIAFSGEELGLVGSKHAHRFMKHDSIMAMINMDMLGVPISKKNRNPIITGYHLSNLQAILNKTLYEKAPQFGKDYFHRDPFYSENLFSRSDNYWFATKGVPAHTILATHPRNRYYHSLNDEPKTLDYELLAKNIKAIALGSTGLADGSETPTRINPSRITDLR